MLSLQNWAGGSSLLSLLPTPHVSVEWLNNHFIPLSHSAGSWIPCMEGREVGICGTIQQQKHFVSFQSLPKLAMGKPFNLWNSRVTSVQSCSYAASHMSSYFCPETGDFGLVPPLKEKKEFIKKKKHCQDGDASQRNTAWWSFLHVLDCPRQRLSLGKYFHTFLWTCWLLCAKAIPQVNSMRFWNNFLLLYSSKRSLHEDFE